VLIVGLVSKNALKKPSAKEHRKVGKVVGICISQRRTDPKKNVGKGLLRGPGGEREEKGWT
jgi:hypothetical protein